MNLEKEIKIEGYKLISSEEFYKSKSKDCIRLFDYSNNCVQVFYKKKDNAVSKL